MTDGTTTWTMTYDADGLRTKRTDGTNTYLYYYDGGLLRCMEYNGAKMFFTYDAQGMPVSMTYNGAAYYYALNLQGDVMAILNSASAAVVNYNYNAWGELLSTTGSLASTIGLYNPLRYRGYIYDRETGLYYLQSRYYNPEICRFINGDTISNLGADGTPVSFNLYAYCSNNPVMGFDPTGQWDWGGVLTGLGITAVGVAVAFFAGKSSTPALTASGATITTGLTMVYAAATDATMVVDLSLSTPSASSLYLKGGISFVADFSDDEVNAYGHFGGGYGSAGGLSYSTGLVSNYDDPEDYAKHFFGINAGSIVGIDHCWNPFQEHSCATQATSVSFSIGVGSGLSYGVGYDYYFNPNRLFGW